MKSFNGLFLWFCRSLALFVCFFSQVPTARAQGNTETLTLEVSIPVGAIQWEQSADNVLWEPISGATADKLELVPKNTTYYRAKIVEAGCAPVFTDVKAAIIFDDVMATAKFVTGRIEMPRETSVTLAELSVSSVFDSSPVDTEGAFTLLIPDNSTENILLVTNSREEIILLSKTIGNHSDPVVSAESSALALLIMYPYMDPISTEEKTELMDLYKSDPEFDVLEQLISGMNISGDDLFSGSNTAISGLVNSILERAAMKPDSKINLRTASDDQPITLEHGATRSSFRITNKSGHSFSGIITEKESGDTLKLFTVAGNSLEGLPVVKNVAAFFFGLEFNKTSNETDFIDSPIYEPGEYIINMRSGLSPELGVVNANALATNVFVLSSLAINNLSDFTSFKFTANTSQAKCLGGIVKRMIEIHKYPLLYEKNKTDITGDILIPILQSFADTYVDCVTENSQSGKFFSSLFGIFNFYEKIKNLSETGTFITGWVSSPSALELCQVYDSEKNAYSCFVLEKAGMTNQKGTDKKQFNACQDTVTLLVRAVEDEKYYPKTNKPLKGIPLNWETKGQFDSFYPGGQKSFETVTDENGEAKVKWWFSVPNQSVKATAFYRIGEKNLRQSEFLLNTTNPKGELKKSADGDGQTGSVNEPLEKPLIIYITDEHGFLDLDDFEITPKITGGGKVELDLGEVNAAFYHYKWTLGSEENEQKVAFMATSKECNWEIEPNPIIFTAFAVDNEVFNVTILPENPKVKKGESVVLTAKAYNVAGRELDLEQDQWKWEQFGEDFSTLEPNGSSAILRGLKPGKVTVMATAFEINKSVELTVTGDPSKIEIVSGNNQFRNTSGYMPENLKVKVTDDAGNPKEGVSLEWEMASGKGKLDDAVTVTDINGEAENKFFVDYSNEKHDVLVSFTNNKEVNVLFLETLRLIPIGPNNSWDFKVEVFVNGEKNTVYDEIHNTDLNGNYCLKRTYSFPEYREDRPSCWGSFHRDISQTELISFGMHVVGPNYKNYFNDQDTLFSRDVMTEYGMRKDAEIVTVFNDREIMIERYPPLSFCIQRTYIKRGVGMTKIEIFQYHATEPKDPNWIIPPLIGVPPIPRTSNLHFTKWELVGSTIVD